MGTTINERINVLLEKLRINANTFSKAIGKSYTAVDGIVKGKSKPGYEFLESILAAYPQVNPGWLLAGEGEMFKVTAPTPESNTSFGEQVATDISKGINELRHVFEEELRAKNRLIETLTHLLEVSMTQKASEKSFLNGVAAHRSGSRKPHTTQQTVEPVLVAVA